MAEIPAIPSLSRGRVGCRLRSLPSMVIGGEGGVDDGRKLPFHSCPKHHRPLKEPALGPCLHYNALFVT